MNSIEFVAGLAGCCRDAAVVSCLQTLVSPPGRKPQQDLVELSTWFRSLSLDDQTMLTRVMHSVADMTLFGVLCVLDGVRAIEDVGEKTEFELFAKKGSLATVISPSDEDLHDIYKSLAKPT